jgi:hypothetical protein
VNEIQIPVFDWMGSGAERRRVRIGTVSHADDEQRVQASRYIGAAGRGISLPPAFTLTVSVGGADVTVRYVVIDGRVSVTGSETAGDISANTHRLIARHFAAWELAAIEAVLGQSMFVASMTDADGNPSDHISSGGSGVLMLGPGKATPEGKRAHRRAAEALKSKPQSGRPVKRTPEWWQHKVVRPYLDAVEWGSDGYVAVSMAADVSESGAHNAVSEARKLGLIPKGQ